jgi:hypothetical protein
VSLHGNKWLGKKDRKGWCCDNILVHLKEFGWELGHGWNNCEIQINWHYCLVIFNWHRGFDYFLIFFPQWKALGCGVVEWKDTKKKKGVVKTENRCIWFILILLFFMCGGPKKVKSH